MSSSHVSTNQLASTAIWPQDSGVGAVFTYANMAWANQVEQGSLDVHQQNWKPPSTGAECSDPRMEWAKRFEQGIESIRARITEWSRNPTALTDDDIEPPSSKVFARAMEIVDVLKVQVEALKVQVRDRLPPQDATLLNLKGVSVGYGGEISIELAGGRLEHTYRVDADGSFTEMFFRDHRLLIRRKRFTL
jgi:hypothetical protein